MRASAIFIAVCMVVIAASAGLAAYLTLAFSTVEAAAVAAGTLSTLAAYSAFSSRAQERAEVSRQIAGLSRGTTELARQVGDLGRRVIATEAAVAHANERARTAADPLYAEIETVGALVTQLAQSVAAHEAALAARASTRADTMVRALAPEIDLEFADEPVAPVHQAAPAASAPAPAFIEAPPASTAPAISIDQIDLYLQPIVTLPQRKTRYYEALPRLRGEGEAPLAAVDRLAIDDAGLSPELDLFMLERAVQIARRLAGKNREAGVFYRLSGALLGDDVHFPRALELLSAHTAIAPSLFLGVSQTTWDTIDAAEEEEALAKIVGLGFRLSLDAASDLRLEARQLAALGFRFVKAPTVALLSRVPTPTADIHPSDLASLLRRYGVDLIAGDVETEGMVVDLLDYEVSYGQGKLFSAPRPVRPEVFQAAAGPTPQAAAAAASPPGPAAPTPPARRREAEPAAPARAAGDANRQGLAKLARNLMRRA